MSRMLYFYLLYHFAERLSQCPVAPISMFKAPSSGIATESRLSSFGFAEMLLGWC